MSLLICLPWKHLSILYHFETTQDMKSWLRRRMFELSEHLQRKRQGKKRKLVQEIEAYIEERLEPSGPHDARHQIFRRISDIPNPPTRPR